MNKCVKFESLPVQIQQVKHEQAHVDLDVFFFDVLFAAVRQRLKWQDLHRFDVDRHNLRVHDEGRNASRNLRL